MHKKQQKKQLRYGEAYYMETCSFFYFPGPGYGHLGLRQLPGIATAVFVVVIDISSIFSYPRLYETTGTRHLHTLGFMKPLVHDIFIS